MGNVRIFQGVESLSKSLDLNGNQWEAFFNLNFRHLVAEIKAVVFKQNAHGIRENAGLWKTMAAHEFSQKSIAYCFLCKTISDRENRKITSFAVTEKNVAAWVTKVPGLSVGERLCEKHFEASNVVKGKHILEQFYPFKKWILSRDAVPKYFLSE